MVSHEPAIKLSPNRCAMLNTLKFDDNLEKCNHKLLCQTSVVLVEFNFIDTTGFYDKFTTCLENLTQPTSRLMNNPNDRSSLAQGALSPIKPA